MWFDMMRREFFGERSFNSFDFTYNQGSFGLAVTDRKLLCKGETVYKAFVIKSKIFFGFSE